MESLDKIFDKLVRLEDDKNHSILLRNKASFTSQISDQMFIESYFKNNVRGRIRKRFIKEIILKFHNWIKSILGISNKTQFAQGIDYADQDMFGHEYSELFGEEFDLDNVFI
ncbi:hypothetical protein C6P40_001338 [Pichia californica]|uniref:Uncharacterized protein n=1 Tax=Pichia californica TaxID=460514 RepID=A0A9P6WL88_9ASCO|nr:hypothetical protein C6P42_001432 [[Candida] californica]KAG0688162.1 hypothetical protein C6P40_001338 [[Candida] californica]